MGKSRRSLVCSMCKQACRHPAALIKHIDDVHIKMGNSFGTITKESAINSLTKGTKGDFKPLEPKLTQESEMDLRRSTRLMSVQSYEPRADKVLEISYSRHTKNVSQDKKEKPRPVTEAKETKCGPCDAISSDLDNHKKLQHDKKFSPDSYDENDNDCSVGIKRKREPSMDNENQAKKPNVVDDANQSSVINPAETAKELSSEEIPTKILNDASKSISVDTAKFYATKSSGLNDKRKQGVTPSKKVVMEVLSNDPCDKDIKKSSSLLKNEARSCPDKRDTLTLDSSKPVDVAKSPKQLAQAATREAFLRSLKSASKEEARQQFKNMAQRRSLPSPLQAFPRNIIPIRPKLNIKSGPSGRIIDTSPVRPSSIRKSLPTITPPRYPNPRTSIPATTPPRNPKPQKSSKEDQSSPKKSNCKSSVKKSLLYKAILNSFLKSQPNSPRTSSGTASLLKTFRGSRKCLKFDEEEKNLPVKEVNRRHSDPVMDKSCLV